MNKSLRLLIVEDSETDALMVVRLLRKAGYEIREARVENAAQMRAALKGSDWDVVIADYRLPQLDAPAALGILNESGKDIPFIVVSGMAGEDPAVAMLRAGAHDYLMKDKLDRLAPAIERELREAHAKRERRRAEEESRQFVKERRELEFIINHSPAVAFLWKAAEGWPVEYVSDNVRQFGWAPEDFYSGRVSYASIVHAEDLARVAAEVASYSRDTACEQFAQEYRLVTPEGRIHTVDDRTWIRRNEQGDITHYQGIVLDITDRKHAEEELMRERNLLNIIMTMIPDNIYFKDRGSRFVRTNNALARYFGLNDPKETDGKSDADFFSSEHAQQAYEDEQRVMTTGQPIVGLEEKETWPDGHVTWVSSTKVPIRDASGDIVGLVGISRDITAHKRAEAALRESEERLRAMFEGVTNGILVADVESGALITANPAICAMLGYTEEELLRLSFKNIHPRERLTEVEEIFRKQVSREQRFATNVLMLRKDGSTFPADINAVPLMLGDRLCLLGVFQDRTEFNEMETQMRQAQKIEAVGRLAGGIAHDFNNVIGVILGYCDLSLKSLRHDDPLSKSLRQIRASAERASKLTQQLLAFSRKQPLRPEVLDLNATMKNMVNMLRRLIGEDIDLSMALADDLFLVKADPSQIEQVVINLVVNSRDAMPRGGEIVIETANVDTTAGEHRGLVGVAAGLHVMLRVSDTGSGMDQETKERAFEPFFTTKPKDKGTGLGLSTVYGIVRQSGGHICVDTELSRGTTFRIYLPRTREKPVAKTKLQDDEVHRGIGDKILLVEDEDDMREIVQELLEDLGYDVTSAANGGEALLIVEEGNFRPDLIITDIVMPGISGIVLAERLRRSHSSLQVLFMTGYTDDNVIDRGVLEQGVHLIQKPFKVSDLAREIQAILRAETSPSRS